MRLEQRLANLRTERGLSQGQLARAAHLSPSHISMFESGRRVPRLESLVLIADVYGLRVSELLTGVNFGEKVNVIPFDEIPEGINSNGA